MRWVLLVLLAAPAIAQNNARLAMQASIAKQRASVARQTRAAPLLLAMPAVTFAAPAPRPACSPVPAGELNDLIGAAAREHGVSADVVREVARQESAFRPCAVSRKGAEGLMQLMPATQSTLAVSDPFNPGESLMAGAKLLRQLLERYNGNLALALSAYNAGPGRVDRTMTIPEIPETRNYVANILDRLEQ